MILDELYSVGDDQFDTDELLGKLRYAIYRINQYKDMYDEYTLASVKTVYDLLRSALMKDDKEEYNRAYEYTSAKHTDAFDLLMGFVQEAPVNESGPLDNTMGGNWNAKIDNLVNSTKTVRVFCSQCGGEFNAPRRPDGKVFGFSHCHDHEGMQNLDESTGEEEWNKQYPDNARGAIEFLTDGIQIDPDFVKNEFKWNPSTCSVRPDPQVEGVWAIENKETGYAVIIYMKGYKEPFGNVRENNDFETFYPEVDESVNEAKTVGDITIDNGKITYQGKAVGELMSDLKHGYHPAVRLTVNGKTTWFEQDTPNLIDTIFGAVAKAVGAESLVDEASEPLPTHADRQYKEGERVYFHGKPATIVRADSGTTPGALVSRDGYYWVKDATDGKTYYASCRNLNPVADQRERTLPRYDRGYNWPKKMGEGWESGPEERTRERDLDDKWDDLKNDPENRRTFGKQRKQNGVLKTATEYWDPKTDTVRDRTTHEVIRPMHVDESSSAMAGAACGSGLAAHYARQRAADKAKAKPVKNTDLSLDSMFKAVKDWIMCNGEEVEEGVSQSTQDWINRGNVEMSASAEAMQRNADHSRIVGNEQADLTKIRTDRLKEIVHTFSLYKNDPRTLAAWKRGAAELRKRGEYVPEAKVFANEMVEQYALSEDKMGALRAAYAGIERIDPASDSYKQLIARLDSMDEKTLKMFADADIKFISGLARNRLRNLKRSVATEGKLNEALQDSVATQHKEDADIAKAQGDKIGYYNHMYHYYNRKSSVYSAEARYYGTMIGKGKKYNEMAWKLRQKAYKCQDRVEKLGGKLTGEDTFYDREGARARAADIAANVNTSSV